ncbi:hypothetical protein CXB51_019978 [Gossypium anomalum]|uniref:F-box domain-containing protein n=1 Tax=Gossypium anomalum TaxID=47600 RepID=A0A8J6D0E9_9ROSI|nr:hypothetical protein CXB51_019978 [Gossypium anomalum]
MEVVMDSSLRRLVNRRLEWLEMTKDQVSDWNAGTTRRRDRLSALPNTVLSRILSKMPMDSVVRTSILSKRWSNLWKHTQGVDFHSLPFSDNQADYSPITHCLDLLLSPQIIKFTAVGHVSERSNPDVQRWVNFALSKNVRQLTIGLMSVSLARRFFQLPDSLFSNRSKTLEHLVLSFVDFKPPRPGQPIAASVFSSLKLLVLTHCKLADATVDLCLRKCVLLEELVINMCEGLKNVNISGPNLRLISFRCLEDSDDGEFRSLRVDAPLVGNLVYSGDLIKFYLNNCPVLQILLLQGRAEPMNEAYTVHVRELIDQIRHVNTMILNFAVVEFVAKEYYTRGIPFQTFQNLKHVFWYGPLKSPNAVYNLVAFLGDCPSLIEIAVDFREESGAVFCQCISEGHVADEYEEGESSQRNPYEGGNLEKLEIAEVRCFSGFDGEMLLVRLLLEKAVNLRKLWLFWRLGDLSVMHDNVLQDITKSGYPQQLSDTIQEEANSIIATILDFRKASSRVRIKFGQEWRIESWRRHFGD